MLLFLFTVRAYERNDPFCCFSPVLTPFSFSLKGAIQTRGVKAGYSNAFSAANGQEDWKVTLRAVFFSLWDELFLFVLIYFCVTTCNLSSLIHMQIDFEGMKDVESVYTILGFAVEPPASLPEAVKVRNKKMRDVAKQSVNLLADAFARLPPESSRPLYPVSKSMEGRKHAVSCWFFLLNMLIV